MDLTEVVEHVGHYLPAQGPIGVFIHHNTLHAFEDEPFERAVVEASGRFGCAPFLSEERYRGELQAGRITERDIDAVLDLELKGTGATLVIPDLPRRELFKRVLLHGIVEAHGPELSWLLAETDALVRFRSDLPERDVMGRDEERHRVARLWKACTEAVERLGPTSIKPAPPTRHRDAVLAVTGMDPDEWVRPVLIRFVSAYLDQGFAYWPMPGRGRGLYACFQELYARRAVRWCGEWARHLVASLEDDRAAHRDAQASLRHSLDELGVTSDEWERFLTDEALSLRGWAGMVNQLERRPDRAPAYAVPARLLEHLAVQLLLSRAALTHAMRSAGIQGPLATLREQLTTMLPRPPAVPASERAWPLFQVAQLCALPATRMSMLAQTELERLDATIGSLDGVTRRRLLHLAYERHLRHRFYDAIAQLPVRSASSERPRFQAIFCLDDREESMRRHLEEVEPRAETFGTGGFYGVAMYYRGAHAAHARPLCPVAITPQHYVAEIADRTPGMADRLASSVDRMMYVGSRTFWRGAVISAVLGALWAIPLVLRVAFPWLRRLRPAPRAATRLKLDHTDAAPPLGRNEGFTVDEMASIVEGQLAPIGILKNLAPLVFTLGHGSTSLNNPQESAYDCGACGGGRGGPNGRAFAQMANDPRVRAVLAARGVVIPEDTWFVGGQRNTASNDIDLYDEEQVPESLRALFEDARRALDVARRREAHERCRRFESAPAYWLPEAAALLHVQARATDLAQPRAECGHATNAACVIGRRSRTRGLFLDRRAFLVSYDPTADPDGAQLAKLLGAFVPVVVGISLEYFFGFVDPTGYGCGTKLPHNVTGLLGVMDGAQSDLRTGLPWQMLEIHEPVRLSMIVEAEPELLLGLIERDATLSRLVRNRWMYIAALRPSSQELFEIDAQGARLHVREELLRTVPGASRAHYAGRRGHLGFVRIEPT